MGCVGFNKEVMSRILKYMSETNGKGNGDLGRFSKDHLSNGKFAPGNKASCGNPNNRKASILRNTLLACVEQKDIQDIMKKLLSMAKKGDMAAIKEVLDRTVGKPTNNIEITDARQTIEEMSETDLIAIASGEIETEE